MLGRVKLKKYADTSFFQIIAVDKRSSQISVINQRDCIIMFIFVQIPVHKLEKARYNCDLRLNWEARPLFIIVWYLTVSYSNIILTVWDIQSPLHVNFIYFCILSCLYFGSFDPKANKKFTFVTHLHECFRYFT